MNQLTVRGFGDDFADRIQRLARCEGTFSESDCVEAAPQGRRLGGNIGRLR